MITKQEEKDNLLQNVGEQILAIHREIKLNVSQYACEKMLMLIAHQRNAN